jgi:hypothetical protein
MMQGSGGQALVTAASAAGKYLVVTPFGQVVWTDDPASATAFESMREAARAALRLPASVKAYGLPRDAELSMRRAA